MNIEKVSPEFAVDLIKLVNGCKGITYNATVDYRGKSGQRTCFKYTTLDKIYNHVKTDNNFAILEPIGTNEKGQPALQIILVHKSGEVITSDYYVLNMPQSNSKQDEGAAITYTKRYALGSFLGLSTDEDNDANPNGEGMPIGEPIDYRAAFIKLCDRKGIDSIAFAQEHGLNKKTTQAEYQAHCVTIEKMPDKAPDKPRNVVSIDEI